MSERDLDARLDAVERALTDDETDISEIRDPAAVSGDVDALEERVAELESRIDDIDAALQAVRGYAGNVRAVNREVERRASAALAKAEALETAVEDGRLQLSNSPQEPDEGGPQAARRSQRGSAGRERRANRERGSDGSRPVDGREDETVHRGREGEPVGRGREPAPGDGTSDPGPDSETTPSTDEPPAGASRDRRSGPQSVAVERNGGERGGRDGDRDGSGPAGGNRIRGDHGERGPSGGDGSGDDSNSQTEQFIERVRDAL